MEIIERKENPLLNRVEINFVLKHDGKSTPSRKDMREQVASLEPGSSWENVVVKDIQTSYGQAKTTGLGLIYANAESMSVEPAYVLERHKAGDEEPAAPAEEPAAEEATEEEQESEEIQGGEE